MRALPLLLLSLLLVTTACGDDGGAGTDASATPDGTEIDAASEPPDAMPDPDPDAGPTSLCGRLCATIMTCFEQGPGGECEGECSADLADCTLDELGTLDGCSTLGCEQIFDCIVAVPCVDTGKGSSCGDGTCDPDESCGLCADDCGACVCGDSTCSPGECATCAADCPGGCVCPHDTCTAGELLDPGCDPCVGQVCAVDSYCCENDWDETCVGEAESICGKDCPDVCGDGVCAPGEESTCPQDCKVEPPPPEDAGVPEVDAAP